MPRLPFDKFITAKRTLTTQMKATGEVMAISSSFEGGLMKAIRSLEQHVDALDSYDFSHLSKEELFVRLTVVDDQRIWVIAEALRKGISKSTIHEITMIDEWFIDRIHTLVRMEEKLRKGKLTDELLAQAKRLEFPDNVIARYTGISEEEIAKRRYACGITARYKMVDTCAAEFEAKTPYFYSVYNRNDVDEAAERVTKRRKILVLGSGPIRIGQGIEFDYCSVHATWAFSKAGFETIIINNNPETVSTDFDIADKLYFEPLTPEDVKNVIDIEHPDYAVVQFGGQTAIKLTAALTKFGVPILGTDAKDVDAAEDREIFDQVLQKTGIKRAEGATVFTAEEAKAVAHRLGYPVLVRPSYVLGGQGMQIAISDEEIEQFMAVINRYTQEHPILVDKYLQGQSLSAKVKETIAEYTRRLAMELHIVGLINVQFIAVGEEVYIIEANPRSSRTVPYISKVTGIPIVDLAARCMLGHKITEFGYKPGLAPEAGTIAIKMPVFSTEKIRGAEISVGPEMKSTGECLGISRDFNEALYKAFMGAGVDLPRHRQMIITVKDADKGEIIDIARRYANLGYSTLFTRHSAQLRFCRTTIFPAEESTVSIRSLRLSWTCFLGIRSIWSLIRRRRDATRTATAS